MHTIGKDGDGTWWVARCEIEAVEMGGSRTCIALLFSKLNFASALCLCNSLNGGNVVLVDAELRFLERCAV